jgi:DNA-binding NtrC family response regulator
METISDYQEVSNPMDTFSEKVLKTLKKQGRSKTWLAKFLGISRVNLYERLRSNTWKHNEMDALEEELNIR